MKTVVILAAALALSACATQTPYQPVPAHDAAAGGYSDQQIETNRWKVEFSGNDLTSRQVVERYLMFRAAQLTKQQGYDWFEAIDRHTDKQSHSYIDSDPYFAGWPGSYWGLYRPGRFGWRYGYWGDPAFGAEAVDVQNVTQYTASVEITMGKGTKPANDAHAYSAQDVINHLQGSIQYPTSKS